MPPYISVVYCTVPACLQVLPAADTVWWY